MIMRSVWFRVIVAVLVPALLLLGCPVACQAGDSGSDGAAISVGLFVAAIVVLAVIGLRSDVENVFARTAPGGGDPRHDALVRRVSVVLDDMKMGRESADPGPDSDVQVAGGIGLRMEF
jgi:hypothetical protein